MLLSSHGKWPQRSGREAMQVFSEGKVANRTFRWLGPQLLKAPDETIQNLSHTLGRWLTFVMNSYIATPSDTCLKLLDRLIDSASIEDFAPDDYPVSRAINHPLGNMAEALINWWYRTRPKASDGLPQPLKIRFNRMADSRVIRLPHGRVIMAAHLSALYLVDPQWTVQSLLPYFDWDSDPQEARPVWEGYLWTPRISRDLLDSFKSSFLATARHYKNLGEHDSQYASLLTIAAVELRDLFTDDELRDAFNALPVEGLAKAARMLAKAISDAGDQREDYSINRIIPLISEVWPKSHDRRSGAESAAFAEVCIRSGSQFRKVLGTLQHLLHKSTAYHLPVKELAESGLATRYPSEALKLLDTIVDENYQWPPDELGQCLNQIGTTDNKLRSTPGYQRLIDYGQRFGKDFSGKAVASSFQQGSTPVETGSQKRATVRGKTNGKQQRRKRKVTKKKAKERKK